jgi:hypothetical protein
MGAAKTMKRRGLIALAIIAAALAVYVVLDARHREGVTERTSTSARTRMLPAFERARVRYITIRRHDQSFSILHSPSPSAPAPAPAWHLELEGDPPADDAAIDDLLAALDLAESDRIADMTPAAAGIDPPMAEVDLETPTGALALRLGRADATGQGVYARAGADGPIRVIGRRVLELVDRGPDAFRDRRLFPVDPAAITSIAWRGEGGGDELIAVAGRWQNGRKEWVANERVAESLRRLQALRIESFEPLGAPAKPNGARVLTVTAGATRVAVQREKAEPADQGETAGGGVFIRGNERVRVAADAFESAWRSLAAAAARDDRLLSQAPETVTRIELHDDHGRVDLRRVRGAWAFSTPKVAYAADTRAVDEWLARLGTVKAAIRSGGANARHLTVEGRVRQQIDVAAPAEVYALLAPEPSRFRERSVLSFARFDLRRLQRTAGGRTQALTTDDGGTWRVPSGASADAAHVALVVDALSDLRAEQFVAAPPPGEPTARLEVDIKPPGEPRPIHHVVQVWARKGDDCVARLDADATFKPEGATCAALRLDLLATDDAGRSK